MSLAQGLWLKLKVQALQVAAFLRLGAVAFTVVVAKSAGLCLAAMEPRPKTVQAYWKNILERFVTNQEREVKTHFGVRETETHHHVVAKNRQDFETWNWQVCIEASCTGGEHQWKDAKEVCEYREHTHKYILQGGETVYQLHMKDPNRTTEIALPHFKTCAARMDQVLKLPVRYLMCLRLTASSMFCIHKLGESQCFRNGHGLNLWEACPANSGASRNQLWIYEDQRLKLASAPGLCINMSERQPENGRRLHLWQVLPDDHGCAGNQRWIYDRGDKRMKLAKDQKFCINILRDGAENGNQIHLWEVHAGAFYQQWDMDYSEWLRPEEIGNLQRFAQGLVNLWRLARSIARPDHGNLAHVCRNEAEWEPVDKLLYTHQAPSDHFKDGRSVKSLVEDLYCKRVAVDADFLVLDVVCFGEEYWSLRNRRLMALKHYQDRLRKENGKEVVRVKVHKLPVDDPCVLMKFLEAWSTRSFGKSVEPHASSKTRKRS